MIDVDETTVCDEETVVLRWRLREFNSLGFREWQSLSLSDSPNADLSLARRLIAQGCEVDTAYEILR